MRKVAIVALLLAGAVVAWRASGLAAGSDAVTPPAPVAGRAAPPDEALFPLAAAPERRELSAAEVPIDALDARLVLVRDAEGNPIEGASVSVTGWVACLTDSAGHALLPADALVPPMVALCASAPRFHPERQVFRREEPKVLILSALLVLEGSVLDARTGAPLPGARLSAADGLCSTACGERTAVADAEGRYRIERLPAGAPLVVMVEATGCAEQTFRLEFRPEGPLARHDFRLEPLLRVEGTVLAQESGDPLPGALVRSGTRRATTDGLGRFALRTPTDGGGLSLRVSSEERCELTCRWEAAELGALAAPLELVLVRAVSVEGLVEDALGAPVAGADGIVSAGSVDPLPVDPRGELRPRVLVFKTDKDGRFAAPGALIPGRTGYSLQVRAQGHYRSLSLEPGEPGFVVRVKVVLDDELPESPTPTGAIEGLVTLAGTPVDAHVRWKGRTRVGWTSTDDRSGELGEGKFRIEDAEPGPVELEATPSALGYLRKLERQPIAVEVVAGSVTTAAIDLALALELDPIVGTVRDANGSPVAGVRIQGHDPRARDGYEATSEVDGSFRMLVPLGIERLVLWAREGYDREDRLTQPRIAHSGERGVDLVLLERVRLRARAVDIGTGEPIPDAKIAWKPAGSLFYEEAWPAAVPGNEQSGESSLAVLPGALHVLATSDGYVRRSPVEVLARAGADQEVEIPLERGFQVIVHLAKGEDPLPREHTVLLLEERARGEIAYVDEVVGNYASRTLWDAGDRFFGWDVFSRSVPGVVAGLAEDTYAFVAFPPDISVEPARVALSERTQEVEITWYWR